MADVDAVCEVLNAASLTVSCKANVAWPCCLAHQVGKQLKGLHQLYHLGDGMQAGVDLTDLSSDESQQTLSLTILDGPTQTKTKQDVIDMSFLEFAMLTTVSQDVARSQGISYDALFYMSC